MTRTGTFGSEVARLQEQIATEYMAARLGLLGLSYGTSQHRMITARMERMGRYQEQLQKLVGSEAIATRMLAETLAQLTETPTRQDIETLLRFELGLSEETEILLDYIRESWDTFDLLEQRFGAKAARSILAASRALLPGDTLEATSTPLS